MNNTHHNCLLDSSTKDHTAKYLDEGLSEYSDGILTLLQTPNIQKGSTDFVPIM